MVVFSFKQLRRLLAFPSVRLQVPMSFLQTFFPATHSPAYCHKEFLLSRWRTSYLSLMRFIKFLPTHSYCLSNFWMTAMILWLHWMCFLGQHHLQTWHRYISVTWFCIFVQINFIFVHCCTQFAAYKSCTNLITSDIAAPIGGRWVSLTCLELVSWNKESERNHDLPSQSCCEQVTW